MAVVTGCRIDVQQRRAPHTIRMLWVGRATIAPAGIA